MYNYVCEYVLTCIYINVYMCVRIYIYMCLNMKRNHTYIYIHIYIERERERYVSTRTQEDVNLTLFKLRRRPVVHNPRVKGVLAVQSDVVDQICTRRVILCTRHIPERSKPHVRLNALY